MASESPFFRHTQCQAGANLYNPATLLYGPGGTAQFLCGVVSDVRTVSLQSVAGARVDGIIQNSPAQGQAVDFCFGGVTKAVAGGAITITSEARLTCDANGRVIAWVTGGNKYIMGIALENAGAAGDVITVQLTPTSFTAIA